VYGPMMMMMMMMTTTTTTTISQRVNPSRVRLSHPHTNTHTHHTITPLPPPTHTHPPTPTHIHPHLLLQPLRLLPLPLLDRRRHPRRLSRLDLLHLQLLPTLLRCPLRYLGCSAFSRLQRLPLALELVGSFLGWVDGINKRYNVSGPDSC
jgi:hypothetical protein